MRVAVYHGPRDTVLEDRPVPAIGPGELLVRMVACGMCGSDLMDWYLEPRVPTVLGHEPSGLVVQVGEGVTAFQVGDRVFVHHHVPCEQCRFCRSGNPVLCPQFHATHLDPGGLAELVRVPAPNTARDVLCLPDSVSFAAATFIEPLGCALRAVRRAGATAGDVVAVVGSGGSGLLFGFAARRCGAVVVLIDLDERRRAHAERFGFATLPTIDREALQAQFGRPADVVALCVGSPAAAVAALDLLGPGGHFHIYAPPPPGSVLPLDPTDIFLRELEVGGTYSCGPEDTRAALDAIARGEIPVQEMVTDVFPLEKTGVAMDRARTGGETLKVLIHIDPTIDPFGGGAV